MVMDNATKITRDRYQGYQSAPSPIDNQDFFTEIQLKLEYINKKEKHKFLTNLKVDCKIDFCTWTSQIRTFGEWLLVANRKITLECYIIPVEFRTRLQSFTVTSEVMAGFHSTFLQREASNESQDYSNTG